MISGFTIIRNGDKLGYPYIEAIKSLAPLVDEMVICAGNSDDTTNQTLEQVMTSLPCSVKLIHSPWDANSLKGGLELSRQTNIALEHCSHDICFYIQADEGLDEKEYPIIREDLQKFANDPCVDALSFHWRHFYGNFNHTVYNRKWYRREARVIKKSSGLKSYGDAQGFRIPTDKGKWKKARAALSRAHVHHYGWVRPLQIMVDKTNSFNKLWHGDQAQKVNTTDLVYVKQYGVKHYPNQLPRLMLDRAKALQDFNPFLNQKMNSWFEFTSLMIADAIEQLSGWRIGEYSSYKYIKKY